MPILGFEVEWYDSISGLLHKLFLKYWTDDNTIEILTDKSAFLKRIYLPEVKLQDLHIGNTLSM
ncbi:hypothetical protein EON65_40080 [archaeon]|nr:MAG: hypothetical protein EON65_40080 [archaeon]